MTDGHREERRPADCAICHILPALTEHITHTTATDEWLNATINEVRAAARVEVAALRATVARVEALCDEAERYRNGNNVGVGTLALRAALAPPADEEHDGTDRGGAT